MNLTQSIYNTAFSISTRESRSEATETNNVNDADHRLAKNCEQSGNGECQSSALVSPTKILNRDVAPNW